MQYVNPWDMLEDHKSPAPLNWAWFGTVREDRMPSRHLDHTKRLMQHTHQKRRPMSYYTHYELDDDDDDDSDNDIDRTSQPATPSTPGGNYSNLF